MSKNLKVITGLALLRNAGATAVTIEYSGEGDDGGIDSIYAEDAAQKKRIDIPTTLHTDLEEWAYRAILDGLPDWVNNEGGYGKIVINTKTYQAATTHNERVTTVDTTKHTTSIN